MYAANTTSARSIHNTENDCQLSSMSSPDGRSDTDRNLAAIMDLVRAGHPISPAVLQVQLGLWLDELDAARAGVPHSIKQIETEQSVARLAAAILGDGCVS